MNRTVTAVLMLAPLLGACASIPTPFLKTDYSTDKKAQWKHNRDETGPEYCQRVALVADSKGQQFLGLGIFLGIVASAAAIAGAAMGPDTNPDAPWIAKNRNTVFVGSAGILAVPTTILLMRSKSGSNASGAARQSMAAGGTHAEQMSRCLKVSAELANSRGAAADLARKNVADIIESLEKTKENAEEEAKNKTEAAVQETDPVKRQELESEAAAAKERAKAAGEQITRELREGPEPK